MGRNLQGFFPRNEERVNDPLHEQILTLCSAGPWKHGLHGLPFSAASQPCIYGDERELPLANLDADDREAAANVVLMAAAWELCEQLGALLNAAQASKGKQLTGAESILLHEQCNRAWALLFRIHNVLLQSAAERYGEEVDE